MRRAHTQDNKATERRTADGTADGERRREHHEATRMPKKMKPNRKYMPAECGGGSYDSPAPLQCFAPVQTAHGTLADSTGDWSHRSHPVMDTESYALVVNLRLSPCLEPRMTPDTSARDTTDSSRAPMLDPGLPDPITHPREVRARSRVPRA
jgi:hypothetical protein